MNTATISTPWKGTGTYLDPYRPALADDYALQSWTDLDGKPGGQGTSYRVQAVCAPAVLTAIQSDLKYAGKVVVLP